MHNDPFCNSLEAEPINQSTVYFFPESTLSTILPVKLMKINVLLILNP